MAQSNGGVSTTSRLTLYPAARVDTGAVAFYAFDPARGFDDQFAGGFYSFKVEEVLPGRIPTVSQAVIKYRDLGQATITLQLTGTNDQQQILVLSTSIQLGNAAATGRLMTKIVGIGPFTAQDIQLTILRAAGGGPVSIAKLVLCGRVEVAQVFG